MTSPLEPGPPTHTERAVAVVALAVPIVLLVALHVMAARAWSRSRALAATGRAANAEVVERTAAGAPRSEGYSVTYRFHVPAAPGLAEREWLATRPVDRATHDATAAGATILIRYDPSDPSRSDIARNDHVTTVLVLTGTIDLALAGVAVHIVRSGRRQAGGVERSR
ncbi:MAG: DUF3592 domain-containing protein [Acidimicrobiia bacterium]